MDWSSQTWIDYAESLAFVGNSLLAPMSKTGAAGIDPAFWDSFPVFGDEEVSLSVQLCRRYAADANALASEDPVQRASVDYTALFIGPPKPLVAPWETMHREGSDETTVGFGQATFEMGELLRDAGMAVSNENNQYADHIGIELLLASVLCRRLAEAPDDEALQSDLESFLSAHPAAWIARLRAAIVEVRPESYIAGIVSLAESLLASLTRSLRNR